MRAPIDITKPHCTPKPPMPKPPQKDPEALRKIGDNIAFAFKDQDHDGSLSVDEIKPDGFYGDLVGKAKHDFADTNHDGKVDRDEYHNLREIERRSEGTSTRDKSSIKLPVSGIGDAVKSVFNKAD